MTNLVCTCVPYQCKCDNSKYTYTTYSTLQIQGIKRFACQTRLLQTQNACKRCAKRAYYKRKTRVNAALNACKRSAKRVYYKRKTRLLETRFARPIETARGPRVWLTRVTSTCSNFVGGTMVLGVIDRTSCVS